jgi:hypothetical protein
MVKENTNFDEIIDNDFEREDEDKRILTVYTVLNDMSRLTYGVIEE